MTDHILLMFQLQYIIIYIYAQNLCATYFEMLYILMACYLQTADSTLELTYGNIMKLTL